MNYRHEFSVNAPIDEVRHFHSRSASMGAITPPPVIVQIHRAPEILGEGDEMDFTMWLGPLPVRWQARIEAVTANSFMDHMVRGPFSKWQHRHSFVEVNKTKTVIHDHVEAELSKHPFWKLIGGLMWLNLPVLFAYRQYKTQRLLHQLRD